MCSSRQGQGKGSNKSGLVRGYLECNTESSKVWRTSDARPRRPEALKLLLFEVQGPNLYPALHAGMITSKTLTPSNVCALQRRACATGCWPRT